MDSFTITPEDMHHYLSKFIEVAINYFPQLILAIIILFVGLRVTKMISKSLKELMIRKEVDPSLIPFLTSLMLISMRVMLLLSVVSMIGVEVTSFMAVLGAASLAIGLALQGSLSNFAGGVMLLLFRPFKVGDVIESQGFIGTVFSIQIFHTVLKTFDNKTIILPNGAVANSSVVNYTREETRLVEWIFGISYGDNIPKAKTIIESVVFSDERVLDVKEEGYYINVCELGASSVNIKVRARVKTDDYWPVFFKMNEAVKMAFDVEGVTIPFPQRDVHIYNK